jgi:hypothetical protein
VRGHGDAQRERDNNGDARSGAANGECDDGHGLTSCEIMNDLRRREPSRVDDAPILGGCGAMRERMSAIFNVQDRRITQR